MRQVTLTHGAGSYQVYTMPVMDMIETSVRSQPTTQRCSPMSHLHVTPALADC